MALRAFGWLDLPPVWTLGFMTAAGACARIDAPFDDTLRVPGVVVMLVALGLILWAVAHLRRAETTVMPHGEPRVLVRTGPYRFSRNPIYVGDLVLLFGFALWTGQPLGAVLALPLAAVLHRRFIVPEERRLEANFDAMFRAWRAEIPRWL
ncbi:MAG: methyltransferase family protein [Paracoccaceae bacterium]